jgi:hypothetical protein
VSELCGLCLGCTDLHQYHDRSCNIDYTGYISNINLGYATLVYATFHSGICHFPFWYMPLSILVYSTFHFCICLFPFWHMPLSILVYATFHSGICHFPFWHMPLSILVYATFQFGICHFPFWYMPLSILVYAIFYCGICHFPFWYMPLSILAYATFHFGICNFPFWYMPLSNLGYVDHMSIKCKDIITNMKYLSQNVMKSVDLIKLIVIDCGNQFVHCPLVFRGAAAHRAGPRRPGRSVRGAAARPVGRPVC